VSNQIDSPNSEQDRKSSMSSESNSQGAGLMKPTVSA